jgi:LacI family transcriptional regulator
MMSVAVGRFTVPQIFLPSVLGLPAGAGDISPGRRRTSVRRLFRKTGSGFAYTAGRREKDGKGALTMPDPIVNDDDMVEQTGLTINDIARLAGVSKKTVSRVINDSPLVKQETRERVQEVIRRHGYTPDPRARALAFRRSFLVGLIYDNPSPQYVVRMQHGMLSALEGTPFQLLLRPCRRGDPEVHRTIRDFVLQQKPVGVVLTPSISEDDALAALLARLDCPYVRIASVDLDTPERMVRTLDGDGAALAAEHLIGLGHRHIAHVHGPTSFRSTHTRFEGFSAALRAAGLELAKDLTLEGSYTFQSGVEAGRVLFGRDDPPTAVFAGNDEMAVGLYQSAYRAGLRVPEDVSIVGYDDTPMAERVWPPLTTVRTSIGRMGEVATRQLLKLDAPAGAEAIEAPVLTVRASTAPPPDRKA